MGQLLGALLGAWLLYAAIISPLQSRGAMVVVRHPEPVVVETPTPSEGPSQVKLSKRKLIIERVPVQYPIFLSAATHALKEEESCRGVSDTDAETFAWGLLGHSFKENGLCKGEPEEHCDVSSTGARGPMQFMTMNRTKDKHERLDSTWDVWGRDGDGDGRKNPEVLADSAYAAAAYLCDLRQKTGSWGHAMCRYYGDNVKTCVYERRVRDGIDQIKTVLAEEEERKRLEAEAAKNPQKQKSSMTLSKANSTRTVR